MAIQTPTVEQSASAEKLITFQEFLKLYDGVRAEWLMGKVEVQVTNNTQHQLILVFLTTLINLYLGFTKIGKLLLAGVVMYVGDDKPGREPDLMIVLGEKIQQIQTTYLDGPADIVVEIVSPESSIRDHGDKFHEYEAAGAREYWLFDPLREQADIYALSEVEDVETSQRVMRYRRVPLDSEGRLVSTILPDFTLNPEILWQDELPDGKTILEMVQTMIEA